MEQAGVNAEHGAIFEEHRRLLFAVAYRMTGSAMDAEDLVQETFLGFSRTPLADVRDARAFLTRILTRRGIDFLGSARLRRETYIGPWLPEPILDDARGDPAGSLETAETVSTAFLLMLETLSPPERAVFVLRDVFDFDYAEIGPMIDRSEETTRRMAARAREKLRESGRQRAPVPVPESTKRRLLDRFLRACRGEGIQDLVELLATDARLVSDGGGKVAAALNILEGAERAARFLWGVIRKPNGPGYFARKARVNGEPGLLIFGLDGKLDSVITFAFGPDRVEEVFIVRNPAKLRRLRRTTRPGLLRLWWYRLVYRIWRPPRGPG